MLVQRSRRCYWQTWVPRPWALTFRSGKDRRKVEIEPGNYEHFEGQRYEEFGITRHSETEEVFVSCRKP